MIRGTITEFSNNHAFYCFTVLGYISLTLYRLCTILFRMLSALSLKENFEKQLPIYHLKFKYFGVGSYPWKPITKSLLFLVFYQKSIKFHHSGVIPENVLIHRFKGLNIENRKFFCFFLTWFLTLFSDFLCDSTEQ